ncbi:MAG TPA: 4Fe-4S dicluster domain-containing protein [Anaeromyxobacteraceae bacterium]|nr:4Fe-4S dicluster domain-containing protein [Anaeromyxobacteraceae bacterium]
MAVRANPSLIEDLQRYGAHDVVKCYQCGNCTAACHFSPSQGPDVSPRRCARLLQIGLEGRIRADLEPWLCYYCGECSRQCPRGAEPGETMMSLRRWLTAQYDFTGISRLFYRSWRAELTAILAVALLTGLGFLGYGLFFGGGNLHVYDGPGAFLPSSVVHHFDWFMASTLSAVLAVNCVRMWYFTMRGDGAPHVPAWAYLKYLVLLPEHFFTQKRYRECEQKRPWVIHLVLMLSYVTMLVLIMFFLKDMQHGPEVRWPAHIFGYLASLGLVVTASLAVYGRVKKNAPHHRHSHESDWMFLGLLLFVATTGILQHVLHRLGLPAAANVAYVVHLMGVVPMLALEVPFSKWAHLAYRPLALYFLALQQAGQAALRARPDRAARPQAVT